MGAFSTFVRLKYRSNIGGRSSLIGLINSLMARFNSLFSRNKFPVPKHRELCPKALDSLLDLASNDPLGRLIELNSL